jgi:hypothetical protein
MDRTSLQADVVGAVEGTMWRGRAAAIGRLTDVPPGWPRAFGVDATAGLAPRIVGNVGVADLPAEQAHLLRAIYDRMTVAVRKIVSVRLTPSAYARGLALALPEKVARARPTGVGRAVATFEIPIEGECAVEGRGNDHGAVGVDPRSAAARTRGG